MKRWIWRLCWFTLFCGFKKRSGLKGLTLIKIGAVCCGNFNAACTGWCTFPILVAGLVKQLNLLTAVRLLCVCVCLAMPKTDTVPPYRKGKLPFPIRLQPDKDATNPWTCFAKPLKELRLRGFWYIVTGEIGETAQFLNKYDFEHSNSASGEPLFQSFPVFCRPIPF